MADENAPATSDRVNLVYETKTGDKTEKVELPFRILVLGDYTHDERSEYLEEQKPINLEGDNHSIDIAFRKLAPGLDLKLPNRLQDDDSELLISLKFTRLADFEPAALLNQVPVLKTLLRFTDLLARASDIDGASITDEERPQLEAVLQAEGASLDEILAHSDNMGWLIANLEKRLSDQLDEILHDPRFRQMEASWRALQFLLERVDFSENCQVAILNVSKQGLLDELEDVAEINRSYYYQLVYSEEYGQFGGSPYGVIIADYEFTHRAPDVRGLQHIAMVSAIAHAPFIAAVAAELFDIDSFSKFSRLRDLGAIFEQPAYVKWNAFRESEDARYVGLTLPSFLLRDPWQTEIDSLVYRESVKDKDNHLLWGNAAFAFATRLADSFAQYRWCLNCTGSSAGLVQGLNMNDGKIPTQFILTDRRESDVIAQGFIPLSVHKGDDTAAFYSAYSTRKLTRENSEDGIDLSDRLAAQLPYFLIVSRISQYLKVMQREHLGSWRNRRDLDQQLNAWLAQYVSDMDNPAPGVRARRPLRRAEVKVREVEGKPDWFVTKIVITPHLKFMGNTFNLAETSRMEKN